MKTLRDSYPLNWVRVARKGKSTSSGYEHTFTIWRFARWEFKITWWRGL